MKRNFSVIPILIILFTCQSCSTVNIVSNKQEGYNKQPKKIYVLANCDKGSNFFCSKLISGLKNKFTEKGIQSDSYIHDALSLETQEDINKKINFYEPEVTLVIQQTVTGDRTCTFELTLIDNETKKHVWKSELVVSLDSYTSPSNPDVIDKAIEAVTDKLIQDKIM